MNAYIHAYTHTYMPSQDRKPEVPRGHEEGIAEVTQRVIRRRGAAGDAQGICYRYIIFICVCVYACVYVRRWRDASHTSSSCMYVFVGVWIYGAWQKCIRLSFCACIRVCVNIYAYLYTHTLPESHFDQAKDDQRAICGLLEELLQLLPAE